MQARAKPIHVDHLEALAPDDMESDDMSFTDVDGSDLENPFPPAPPIIMQEPVAWIPGAAKVEGVRGDGAAAGAPEEFHWEDAVDLLRESKVMPRPSRIAEQDIRGQQIFLECVAARHCVAPQFCGFPRAHWSY